jgi:hypothetical protein
MHQLKRASSYVVIAACLVVAAGGSLNQAAGQGAAAPALDYQFFKDKVQPVFLHKREGHTRCVVCHTVNNAPLHLVPLSAGATSWNEAQSRQNFQLVQMWWWPVTRTARSSNIRSPKRPAAIPIMVAASNSPTRTTRTGRQLKHG